MDNAERKRALQNRIQQKFKNGRDDCDKQCTAPLYDIAAINSGNKSTFRMVLMSEKNYLFCCLPLLQCGNCDKDGTFDKSATTVLALEILTSMSKLLQPIAPDISPDDAKFEELDSLLSVAMPLGRPIDTDFAVVHEKLQNKAIGAQLQSRQPAWKPILHRGKSKISVTITESVRSVQFDQPDMPDVLDIFGSILCAAQLEGPSPEVTLTLSCDDPNRKLAIDNLIFSPCLSSVDKLRLDHYKMRFMPSKEEFVLCRYAVPDSVEMPVQGVFKMRGDKTVDIMLQLHLGGQIKNNFEFFEAIIPFCNRGRIAHADLQPTWGMANVVHSKRWIIWNLGYKFPSKTLEASLHGTIVFEQEDDLDVPPSSAVRNDSSLIKFCTGLNCYAQIVFQTKSHVYSSCTVDPRSVHVSPDTKYKFSLERLSISSDFKIWNSYGDVPNHLYRTV